ncbi:MAG: endolytic transglycosylase MltG [Syntrophus sp. (in: bacteria)]|nr:endolytic transglycosylase MltG [Syntrophus sp. (in: bacteria)]
MLRRQGRSIIPIILLVLLITQTLIFAHFPRSADPSPVNLVVKSGTSLSAIAHQLSDDGVICSPYLFMTLSLLYKGKLIAGEYTFQRNLTTLQVLRKMAYGERNIYILRIPEGFNIYNIADAMEKSHIMKRSDFLKVSKDQHLLQGLGIKADSIEGYLSPDTYYYSREVEVEKFMERIARRTLDFFEKEDIKKRMGELRLSINDTLILASMIEKEAKQKDEKPIMAAVFHNRLRLGMSLDCDPTVLYGMGIFDGPIKKSDLAARTPYNTYTFKGLPKGPICNPDKGSIIAVLYPAQVDYLYFVSRNDGTHVFSRDMKDHNRFVVMYQRNKHTKKQ